MIVSSAIASAGSGLGATVPLVTAIECAWNVIRSRHPDVPPVVVALGSAPGKRAGQTACGRFAASRWQVGDDERGELFVAGEGLRRGAHHVLATLLHGAAHGIASVRDIRDTSRQGRYHNRRFYHLANEVGLTVAEHPSTGWSLSELAPATAGRYTDQITTLDKILTAYQHYEPRGAPGRNRAAGNGVAAVCRCLVPRRIRVRSVEMFDAGPISCGLCGEYFAVPDR